MEFKLISNFEPTGDQPLAIKKLIQGIDSQESNQTLLGVTGSGKTFTMANVIAQSGRPSLILCHNKTLAAQLNELGRTNRLGMASVTKVDISSDLRKATVYISVYGSDDKAEEFIRMANQSSASFQKIVSTRLRLKRTPALAFALDNVLSRESRLNELLRSP